MADVQQAGRRRGQAAAIRDSITRLAGRVLAHTCILAGTIPARRACCRLHTVSFAARNRGTNLIRTPTKSTCR